MVDNEGLKLDALRSDVRTAEETLTDLRQQADRFDAAARDARKALEVIQAKLGDLEVFRATEESHLAHVAQSCVDTLQMTLDEVVAEMKGE